MLAGCLFILGAVFGYLGCISQAKLTLAIYRRTRAGRQEEANLLHARWLATHPTPQPQPQAYVEPPTVPVDLRSLRERFNLPAQTLGGAQSHTAPRLIRTRRCPQGYSAKQILGYNDFGTIHEPQFPGGIDAWPY